MVKLEDLFKTYKDFEYFICRLIADNIPKELIGKLNIDIFKDIEKSLGDTIVKNGERVDNSVLALFMAYKKLSKDNTIGSIAIFTENIENAINKQFSVIKGYEYIHPLDHIAFVIVHECRHAQQFEYLYNKYGYSFYEKLVLLDKSISNEYSTKLVLEHDADVYAWHKIFKNNILYNKNHGNKVSDVCGYILKLYKEDLVKW